MNPDSLRDSRRPRVRHASAVCATLGLLSGLVGCAASASSKSATATPEPAPTSAKSSESAQPGSQPASAEAESAAALGASSSKPESPAPSATPAASTGPANVLLLVVDSMRADMPWAGYKHPIAPNLSALAAESVRYTNAYALSSYTAKSVAGFLSGQYPSTLKRNGVFFTRYSQSNQFLAELLSSSGVHTVSAHGHAYMNRGNGMDQGFIDWQVVSGITFDNTTDNHVTGEKLTELALSQLAKVPAGKPFFGYLHYMDPHDQYVAHAGAPDFGKGPRARYDGEIWYTDQQIGRLLAWLKKQPFYANTTLIVTGDHGEGFGEHGVFRHAFELWNELIHVPMLFHGPGFQARDLDTPRSHLDIAPTVAELMGHTGANPFVGQSLVKELRGAVPSARPVLVELPADTNNEARGAVIDGSYKLLSFADFRYQLFDLSSDPGEKHDLSKTQPERFAELKRRYLDLTGALARVKPWGGMELKGGGKANGPRE